MVFCKFCLEFQTLCAANSGNKRCPPIATVDGTRFQAKVLILHHISPAHLACVEAKQNKELYEANDVQHHPWLNVIVKMDKQLLHHMNQVILDVYNDAKIGTLSAWSWPSRFPTQCFAE